MKLLFFIPPILVFIDNPALDGWTPGVLFWAMGTALWVGPLLFGRNLLKSLLGQHVTLPHKVWHRLNFACVGFSAGLGLLNRWVAHACSTATWATFKLFGGPGPMLAFTVGQPLVLNRRVKGVVALGRSLESR
jgi:intracellular septation protein